MTRATGSIITTVEASISFNWLSSSTRSAGGRSATCSLMPTKLSSSRRLIRSRNSSSAVTHSPPFEDRETERQRDRETERQRDRESKRYSWLKAPFFRVNDHRYKHAKNSIVLCI